MSSTHAMPGPWAYGSRGRGRRDFWLTMTGGEGTPAADDAPERGDRHRGPRGPHGGGPGGRRGRGGRGGMPFGPFPGPMFGRGPKVGRGDVRAALLALLAEEPMHGYQMIRELTERSGGVWRPSPGSVYPTLQQLEDEGLVRVEEAEGRKVFHLTDAGRTHVESLPPELAAPWETVASGEGLLELRDLVMQVGAAVMQVAQAGTPEQVARARTLLADTRRSLYRILAEDDEPAPDA